MDADRARMKTLIETGDAPREAARRHRPPPDRIGRQGQETPEGQAGGARAGRVPIPPWQPFPVPRGRYRRAFFLAPLRAPLRAAFRAPLRAPAFFLAPPRAFLAPFR